LRNSPGSEFRPRKGADIKTDSAKILIVDDEEIVLHFASDALSTVGYEVSATSNQRQALRLIESEKYDFLLTDIRMPDLDGIALAHKALEIDPDLGIIFMTGYADVGTAKKAIATGAYDYIMKPFELPEIRHSVNAAVQKRREHQEKRGSKGLSQLSDLTGALYTVGDSASLLKLILGFALYHFGLIEGSIVSCDRKARILKTILACNIRQSKFVEAELPFAEICDELLAVGETEFSGELINNPVFKPFFQDQRFRELRECATARHGHFYSFSLPATDKLKLVLTIHDEHALEIKESDRQLLSILLSLSSISLENLMLFEEAKIAQSRLEDFKDRLIGLERAATQGMMSSEIAHELNNFIAIIASNVELFEMKSAGNIAETAVKYLENVKKNLARFEKFTNSLSAAGKLATHRQFADLNEMIEEIASFAVHQKRFRSVKISRRLDANLPPVYIDSPQMQQILYNLLNNAADAIGPERSDGEIEIVTSYSEAEPSFTLTVADNGCGFSPDNAQKAFRERFTTKEHGHGFGLTVCRKIIANHGGKITVESAENEGSTFKIAIPCVDPQTAPPQEYLSAPF
jgi:signal transduction histidine kinase/FixJ family two-component response regulator